MHLIVFFLTWELVGALKRASNGGRAWCDLAWSISQCSCQPAHSHQTSQVSSVSTGGLALPRVPSSFEILEFNDNTE
jgi:hypothetical protein